MLMSFMLAIRDWSNAAQSVSGIALLGLLVSCAAALPGGDKPMKRATSYLPAVDIERFIVEKLDLSTFRNSLGPRRGPGMRVFAHFGLRPQTWSNGLIEFKEEGWYYRVRVLGHGDFNRDGIEDVAVCFTDQSLVGTYRTEMPLLLTRFSDDGWLIAIAYEIDADTCRKSRP